jgi:hypothetical protein
MVPRISRYANSQSKVNTADFSANGPFHQKLESLSRRMWAPPVGGLEKGTLWYYERARGSYMDEKSRSGTPTEKKIWERDHPVQQKFTKTDLAKFEKHGMDGLIGVPCAEKNFTDWAQDWRKRVSGCDGGLLQRIVARAILWKTAEKRFSEWRLPQYRAPPSPMQLHGCRAAPGNGSILILSERSRSCLLSLMRCFPCVEAGA